MIEFNLFLCWSSKGLGSSVSPWWVQRGIHRSIESEMSCSCHEHGFTNTSVTLHIYSCTTSVHSLRRCQRLTYITCWREHSCMHAHPVQISCDKFNLQVLN